MIIPSEQVYSFLYMHFKPWAINYASVHRDGTVSVSMNTPENTTLAKKLLKEAGWPV